jgi:hypothetical protein
VDRKAQLPVQLIANSDEGDDTGLYVAVGAAAAVLLGIGGLFMLRGSRRPT